jgi:tRNA/rRNA methyltransferase
VLTRPGFSSDEIAVLRGLFASFDKFSRPGQRMPGPGDETGDDE